MTIYVVRQGDTLNAIANRFGVRADTIAYDNQLSDPSVLVVGQALVIDVDTVTHRVAPGQTLAMIARRYQTSVQAILEANENITSPARVYAGQTITIPFGTTVSRGIDVNGYAFTNIAESTLEQTLPSLTYISLFSYHTDAQGNLTPLDDAALIAQARDARVAPLLCVTNTQPSGGGFSSDIAHAILTNQAAQDAFLRNLILYLRERRYYGVNIDFEYVYPFDRESYNQFLGRVVNELHPLGFSVSTALAPKISADQVGTLYTAHDYEAQGRLADFVVLMTYEWGYTFGPAMAVAPIDQVRRVLDYATSAMPAGKILMGMPNYGYDWTLPFVQGTAASILTNTQAVSLAARVGARIQYSETAQSPFFRYYDSQGRQHEVWFEDARSIRAKLRLVEEYGLAGVSFWTINQLFRANWLLIQSMYSVNKVL